MEDSLRLAVQEAGFHDPATAFDSLWQYALERKHYHHHTPSRRISAWRRRKNRNNPSLATTPDSWRLAACVSRLIMALRHRPPEGDDETRLADLRGLVPPAAWSCRDEEAATLTGVGTGVFRCRVCQMWHTTFYQQQTRGGDEPMTIFVHCLYCNRSWIGG